jgi:hypothetical protein
MHQMMMHDHTRQVDKGVIVHLIRAILCTSQECVEDVLEMPGFAESKLQQRFDKMVAPKIGFDGQK